MKSSREILNEIDRLIEECDWPMTNLLHNLREFILEPCKHEYGPIYGPKRTCVKCGQKEGLCKLSDGRFVWDIL